MVVKTKKLKSVAWFKHAIKDAKVEESWNGSFNRLSRITKKRLVHI